MVDGSRQLAISRPTQDAVLDVYAFAAAGTGASFWNPVAQALPPSVELAAVRLPGRESRFREPPHRSMRDLLCIEVPALVERVADRGRPFVLCGYCSGALVAFEVARMMAKGAAPAALVLADPSELTTVPRPDPERLSADEFREIATRRLELPDAILRDRRMFDLFEPTFRADLRLVDTYVHDGGTVPCDVTLLRVPENRYDSWDGCTTATLTILDTADAPLLDAITATVARLSGGSAPIG